MLAIQLKRAIKSCDDLSDAYGCLLAEGPISVVKDTQRQSKDGAVAWHFLREKRSRVLRLQLTKAPNVAAMRRVNDDQQQYFRSKILEVLSGSASVPEITVGLVNKRMISIDTKEFFSPPDRQISGNWLSTTYDLISGEEIYWGKILPFPPNNDVKFDYKKGKDILSAALREAIYRQKEYNDFDDTCFEWFFDKFGCEGSICSGKYVPDRIGFSPHQNGLFVALVIGVAPGLDECMGEGVTIPWPKVRPLLLKPIPVP